MSQLVAELVDERPCANEVAVHVWSLVIHGFLVFDNWRERGSPRWMKLIVSVDLGGRHFGRARGAITKWSSSPQVSSGKRTSSFILPKTTTGQFCAKSVLSKNLEAVSRIVTDAARAGAKLIFLPEASDFIASAGEVPSLTKPLAQNEFVLGLRAKAKETGVWVSVGVHEAVRALSLRRPPPFMLISVIRSYLLSDWCSLF